MMFRKNLREDALPLEVDQATSETRQLMVDLYQTHLTWLETETPREGPGHN